MKRSALWLSAALVLAPIAALWVRYQEKRITKAGSPLDNPMQEWASSLGIANVDQIRISIEQALQFPSPKWLKKTLERRGLCINQAAGMCLRYGIFIHQDANLTDRLLKHELVHTLQYQRSGSIYKFLRQYLFECLYFGYHHAPMEGEADQLSSASET